MLLNSSFTPLVPVVLPFMNRQRYMHGFDVANPDMGEGYDDYLQPVTELLTAAGITDGRAWMTVDERLVRAGESQRKPRPHVDGRFNIKATKWGGGGGWNHSCNLVPTVRTPVIVAASVAGCRAWEGQFEGTPTEEGDLSHIADQLGEGVILPPNHGFLLSGDCVHESMPMEQDVQRTFLRIALPQLH